MATVTKPKIAPEILAQIEEQFEQEKQVIVHCCFQNNYTLGNLVRIWPSTFLEDKFTGYRSKLIFWENIAVFPYWTDIPPVKEYCFTLVFSGLPKECKVFDFVEEVMHGSGFLVTDIERNESDVYTLKLT
ncbi:hypothetical protein [Cloacibacterium sp.]|jgi:hypothetical protein|uniref:hypothetical protein n=1 Tax=Cloacibacterium sp. TaxID=1913682 RepID=UPI0039E71AD0